MVSDYARRDPAEQFAERRGIGFRERVAEIVRTGAEKARGMFDGPDFSPGGEYRYSSYGYILLGHLMEVAAGADYYDLIASRVFEPAGMHATGAQPEQAGIPDLAAGYMRGPDGLQPNNATLPYRGTPAGGGYSTLGDLDRFATALREHRLLDADRGRLLVTPQVEAGPDRHYAYGFEVELQRGLTAIGHSGAAPGMAAIFKIIPERDWRIIILSNRDAPATTIVTRFVLDQMFENG